MSFLQECSPLGCTTYVVACNNAKTRVLLSAWLLAPMLKLGRHWCLAFEHNTEAGRSWLLPTVLKLVFHTAAYNNAQSLYGQHLIDCMAAFCTTGLHYILTSAAVLQLLTPRRPIGTSAGPGLR